MLSRRAMRRVSCPRATYQRRQPEHTVLYRTIRANLPAFLTRTAGQDGTGGWPAFVRRELEGYLKCGRLAHGLLRVQHLVRYLVRPPLALERLTESSGGQLLYHFRRPWSDGSTALLLDPLELLERLAALVPPPRRPLLAYHGLLAPRAHWRSAIVPKPTPDDVNADAGSPSRGRWTWARLLRRVFAIQILVCERCGGSRRILGAVTEPHAVRRVLAALGLAAEPPPGHAVPTA